jgi:protein-tyrosine phosphatase
VRLTARRARRVSRPCRCARDQLTAVTELLTARGTTIEASLTATIESLTMSGYLLRNGLTETELTALHARLTT